MSDKVRQKVVYSEDDAQHRYQVTTIMGAKLEGQWQTGLVLINFYLPPQPSKMIDEYKTKVVEMVDIVEQRVKTAENMGYYVLSMGDLNFATDASDRSSGKLSGLDKWLSKWHLVDVWKHRLGERGVKGHTWHTRQEDKDYSSRIDYALCSKELLPFIEGIRRDKKERIIGTDHRVPIVDMK